MNTLLYALCFFLNYITDNRAHSAAYANSEPNLGQDRLGPPPKGPPPTGALLPNPTLPPHPHIVEIGNLIALVVVARHGVMVIVNC